MTRNFTKFKKPCFGPFSQLHGKSYFLENPAVSRRTSYGFLLQKDRRMDGKKVGQTDPAL